MHRDSWLQSSSFPREVQNTINNLPFDETSLFREKMDETLHSLKDSRSTLCSLGLYALALLHRHQKQPFLLWPHSSYPTYDQCPEKLPLWQQCSEASLLHLRNDRFLDPFPTTGKGLVLTLGSRAVNLLQCQAPHPKSFSGAVLYYSPTTGAKSPWNWALEIIHHRYFIEFLSFPLHGPPTCLVLSRTLYLSDVQRLDTQCHAQ